MLLTKDKSPEPIRWTAKELREACVPLYGHDWRKALAADTGYTVAAVNAWCARKAPVPFVVRKYVLLKVQMTAVLTHSPVIPYSGQ